MGDRRRFLLAPLASAVASLLYSGLASAGEWQVTPRVEAEEVYTDNVLLTKNDREDDFITSITPGVNIVGASRHYKLNLDYSVENLIYADHGDYNATNQQLHAIGSSELIDDYFYFDASADTGQRLASINGQRSVDNLNANGNRIDYEYYRLSPYFRHDFGGWVQALLRYSDYRYHDNYGQTQSGNGDNLNNNDASQISASLSSSREFTRLSWNLHFDRYDQERARGLTENGDPNVGKDRRESSGADISYAFSREWSVLVRGGEEKNQLGGIDRTNNGSYWAAGVGWTPSRKIGVQLLSGDSDKEASLTLKPTDRTDFALSWRKLDVGTVVGPSWNLKANHRTQHTRWTASYEESLVSQQQLILTGSQPVVVFDPQTGRPQIITIPFYGLDDENFLRKHGEIGMTYLHGRNQITTRLFHERRTYELNTEADETYYGASVGIDFELKAKSTVGIDLQWDRRDFAKLDNQDDFYVLNARWERQFSPSARFEVRLTHALRNDSGDDAPLLDGESLDYAENRLTLRLTKDF